MPLWKCAVCDNKEVRFINIPEPSGLLSNLGLKTPSCKVTLFGEFVLKR